MALCPATTWLLYPYAMDGPPSRVALLPLLSGVPFRVPVPRWELLGLSWRALLPAATLILPLVRLLAATAASAANPQGLSPGTIFTSLVLCSWPVQFSAFFSGLDVLLGRHRQAYDAALEQKTKAGNSEV